jgi:hypothetical protein
MNDRHTEKKKNEVRYNFKKKVIVYRTSLPQPVCMGDVLK